jgi:hypothetical protein
MRAISMMTLGTALAAIVSTTPVYALNDVSYVDIGGADSGTCADAGGQRCRTLARALTQTNAGGVIYCLTSVDNGTVAVAFAPITISQSVTIDCSGNNSSIAAAGAAVTINGAGAVVILRGLRIHGTGAGGTSGINITNAAEVTIDDVKIEHMRAPGSGIIFAPSSGLGRLMVENSFISVTGGNTSTAGILIRPTSGASANVTVACTELEGNTNGIFVDTSGGSGPMNLNVRDSIVTGSANSGIVVATGGPSVTALIDRTTVNYSLNTGVAVAGQAGTVRIGNSTISNNLTGVVALSGANLRSFKNNQIKGNSTDGTPITADSLD